MKKNTIIALVIVVAAVAVAAYFITKSNRTPGKYDSFAQCLEDKGVKFFGAFWCPHCQAQKALFGKSKSKLPYVECSTPDGRGQLQVCVDENISGYPTWEFPDGSREEGEVSLEDLSEKSGCPLPRE